MNHLQAVFKVVFFRSFLSLFIIVGSVSAQASSVFINEIHYDNIGADVGEGVELLGPVGLDLSGWHLWFYSGANGLPYGSMALSGEFSGMSEGYGVLSFMRSGIQNGSPDGVALVDGMDHVHQFLSYEGGFEAQGGVAENLTSLDIGIAETSATPVGFSLQLSGAGLGFADFSWVSGVSSFGQINGEQRLVTVNIAEPGIAGLWLLGLIGLLARRRVGL